jgi:hypothetical protein
VREKLNNDGDRLHREIVQHATFSQSIIDLTKIASDGMASVKAPAPKEVAERRRSEPAQEKSPDEVSGLQVFCVHQKGETAPG